MRYAVVLERGDRNWSAYVPDLPGCVATGATREAAQAEIRAAIATHLQGLREDGVAFPAPVSVVEEVPYCEPHPTWQTVPARRVETPARR